MRCLCIPRARMSVQSQCSKVLALFQPVCHFLFSRAFLKFTWLIGSFFHLESQPRLLCGALWDPSLDGPLLISLSPFQMTVSFPVGLPLTVGLPLSGSLHQCCGAFTSLCLQSSSFLSIFSDQTNLSKN